MVNKHCNHLSLLFLLMFKNAYLSFFLKSIKHNLLSTKLLVLKLSFLNYLLFIAKKSCHCEEVYERSEKRIRVVY